MPQTARQCAPVSNERARQRTFHSFLLGTFEFVSYFEIRASDFSPPTNHYHENPFRRQLRFGWQFTLAATACAILTGCGDKGVELVRVEGYVTLDGKPPPGPGTLYFTPVEALGGEPLRPARSHFGADGHFVARAFDDAVGLIPAKYLVGIHCWEIEPTIDGPPAVSFIPHRYMTSGTSGLEFTVAPGARSMQWNAELTSDP